MVQVLIELQEYNSMVETLSRISKEGYKESKYYEEELQRLRIENHEMRQHLQQLRRSTTKVLDSITFWNVSSKIQELYTLLK